MLRLLCLLIVGAVVAQDHEEVFTIFIDLDDFHVTEGDNHQFLSGDSIGEHNNVVLHMSEAEVKYHQDLHDTHHCEAPSEVHEVVSFIQEKMYEAPSAPSFIDDAISSNYNGNSQLWDTVFKQQAAAPTPQFPFPGMMGGGGMFGMPPMGKGNPNAMMGLGAPPPPAPPAPAAPAAEKKADAPAVEKKALSPEEEESQAVSRFRDAYKAYKLLNHALEGLGEYAQPAQNALTGTGGSPQKTLWDSVVDDDDRKILSLFSGQGASAPPAPRPVSALPSRGNFDDQISSIVDDTFKNVMQELANPNSSGATQAMNEFPSAPFGNIPSELGEAEADEQPEHHHHHHHHHHDEEEAPSAPAPIVAAAQSSGTELLDTPRSTGGLTAEEQKELNALLAKANAAKAVAPEPVAEAASVAAAEPAKVSTPNPGSRPSAPAMTSHIEKAPSARDLIPENVYVQQSVPFQEVLAKEMKHVPKRILIPRMEEPGPVIGGSSRPLHIKINPEDILDAKDAKDSLKTEMAMTAPASRPAAPMHISISSEITNANQGQASEKASAVASANDEALTAPEVVIF